MVIFRFSGRIDHTTFTSDEAKEEGRLRFVDITPGLEESELDNNAGWHAYYTTGRSNYVCNNWFGLARYSGRPLLAGRTYAAIMSTGGLDDNGDPIERSENLIALLADEEPSDLALEEAYAAYAPLRDYLALDTSWTDPFRTSATCVTPSGDTSSMPGSP
jgi:hypothetical protein